MGSPLSPDVTAHLPVNKKSIRSVLEKEFSFDYPEQWKLVNQVIFFPLDRAKFRLLMSSPATVSLLIKIVDYIQHRDIPSWMNPIPEENMRWMQSALNDLDTATPVPAPAPAAVNAKPPGENAETYYSLALLLSFLSVVAGILYFVY